MNHKIGSLVLGLVGIFVGLQAADSTLRYENFVYEKEIATVKIYQANSGFNFPVVNLSGDDRLVLEFDQMKSENDYFQYTLIHCDAFWNPTEGLQKNQLLVGQGFENINDFAFSNGTLTQYVHYKAEIPGENTVPRVSGNYLLLVYRNFDESDVVLTRRIMVLDTKGGIDMTVGNSSQVDVRFTHQEVDFKFNLTGNYVIPKPYEQLTAVVLQNTDWNTAITDLKPQFISGTTYNYEYQTGNQFSGLNEYRFFDIRSLRAVSANVKSRFNAGNQRHAILLPEKTRRFEKYSFQPDYNGRFLIDNKDVPIPGGASSESDYVYVHFTLRNDEELKGKEVYIYGELSDWRLQEKYKLYWNEEGKMYEAVVPLKQAYYNYQYMVVDTATGKKDPMEFEGSHFETENNYIILIYHRNQQLGYDELIAYGLKNTTAGGR